MASQSLHSLPHTKNKLMFPTWMKVGFQGRATELESSEKHIYIVHFQYQIISFVVNLQLEVWIQFV